MTKEMSNLGGRLANERTTRGRSCEGGIASRFNEPERPSSTLQLFNVCSAFEGRNRGGKKKTKKKKKDS